MNTIAIAFLFLFFYINIYKKIKIKIKNLCLFCMHDNVPCQKGSLIFKAMPSFSICTHSIAGKVAKATNQKAYY